MLYLLFFTTTNCIECVYTFVDIWSWCTPVDMFTLVCICVCMCGNGQSRLEFVLVLSHLPPCCGFICHSCASLWRTCRMSMASWGPRARPYGTWWEGSLDRYGLPSTASFCYPLSIFIPTLPSLRPILPLIRLHASSICHSFSEFPALPETTSDTNHCPQAYEIALGCFQAAIFVTLVEFCLSLKAS